MKISENIEKIISNLAKVIIGKEGSIKNTVTALIAGGNILMEDVPGVGKTTLAKALAKTISGDFKRVQFTPDLLPTDILGSSIYNPKDGSFIFKKGPIFTNILLADEINRASPRTQSSLLEAMNEGQVSIEGITYKLPEPFLVIATQNPVEFHGTYPLPEAQLDRFLMKIHIGYPDKDHEIEILYGQNFSHPVDSLKPVIDLNELILIQKEVKNVKVDRSLAGYITDIIEKTRNYPQLDLGASPRGSLMLFRTSQANALISNRNYVIPDDVKSSAVRVLSHRTMLNTKAKYSGIKKEDIILEIINSVKVPD